MHANNGIMKKAALPLLAALSLVAAMPAAAENPAEVYRMVVFSDAGHGAAVMRGKYEKAIARITAAPERSYNAFEKSTNLCVAYTKSGDLDNANDACDSALSSIRAKLAALSEGAKAARTARLTYDKHLALALSNRGVLHAVEGDEASARESFEAATEASPSLSAARTNLARLDTPESDKL